MSEQIELTLKDAVVHDNPAEDETLLVSAEIGDVNQEILVSKEWYCNRRQP